MLKLNLQTFAASGGANFGLGNNKTKISDVIVPAIFNRYVIEQSIYQNLLFNSGIAQAVPELVGKLNGGSNMVNMPFWKQLTGNDETLSDAGALTPDKVIAGQDVATQLFRGRAWAENDLAMQMAGDDPMKVIGDMVAQYWIVRMQAALVSTLKGVFNGPLKNSHVNDLSIDDGNAAAAANKVNGNAVVDTFLKIGDKFNDMTAMIVHSAVYANLVKQNLITFIPNSKGELVIPTYMSKRLLVDDGMPVIPGATSGFKYYSVMFAPGAIGYAEGMPEVPTETGRDVLAGDDVLVTRKHFVLHPRGVKWTGATQVGASPTNSELEIVGNWSKVYQDKNIKMVALVTNG